MSKDIHIENLHEIINGFGEITKSIDLHLQAISSSLHEIKNILTSTPYDDKSIKVQIESSHSYSGSSKFRFGQFVKIIAGFYEGMAGTILKVENGSENYNIMYTMRLSKENLEVEVLIDEVYLEKANAIDYMKDKKSG